MIILDATTKKLQLVLSGVVTTTELDWITSYVDITTTAFTPGSSDGTSNGTTAVDIIAAPAASTQRQLKHIAIQNRDTVSATVTLRYNDNATIRKIAVISLSSGYQLIMDCNGDISIYDTSGKLLTAASASDLTGSTGIVAETAANVYAARTLTGTADKITVTNGDGISGNPTFTIAATYIGQTSLTTLGTITTGVWNGTILTGTYGGTGINNGSKTLTYLKNISLTAADDTGVYTLPTGTKTLVATDVATLSSLSSIGTIGTGVWNGTIITSAYGGTGNGFTKFSGPGTSEKTFTLPNATSAILTDNAAVTVAQGGTGNATATAYAVQCGGTTSTAAHQSIASVGTSGHILTSNGAGALPTFQANAGSSVVVKQVRTFTGAVATGTTTIPFDNSIPTSSEGTAFTGLDTTITPSNTNNILEIRVIFWGCVSALTDMVIALFQDSGAAAIAAISETVPTANYSQCLCLTYFMTAGTTSATTFKIRAGGAAASTLTFNGQSGGRIYGGVAASSMIITEYTA